MHQISHLVGPIIFPMALDRWPHRTKAPPAEGTGQLHLPLQLYGLPHLARGLMCFFNAFTWSKFFTEQNIEENQDVYPGKEITKELRMTQCVVRPKLKKIELKSGNPNGNISMRILLAWSCTPAVEHCEQELFAG